MLFWEKHWNTLLGWNITCIYICSHDCLALKKACLQKDTLLSQHIFLSEIIEMLLHQSWNYLPREIKIMGKHLLKFSENIYCFKAVLSSVFLKREEQWIHFCFSIFTCKVNRGHLSVCVWWDMAGENRAKWEPKSLPWTLVCNDRIYTKLHIWLHKAGIVVNTINTVCVPTSWQASPELGCLTWVHHSSKCAVFPVSGTVSFLSSGPDIQSDSWFTPDMWVPLVAPLQIFLNAGHCFGS